MRWRTSSAREIPTTERDANKKIKTNLLKIRCLACDHVLPVNIGTFIKRLEGCRDWRKSKNR